MVKKENIKKKKIIKTLLTRRGYYAIVKEHFGFRDIHKCKELTVAPFVNENVAAKPSPSLYI